MIGTDYRERNAVANGMVYDLFYIHDFMILNVGNLMLI